jgi:hypothetical protein
MLGIVSVVVMPLLREKEVTGVFELFSDRAYAFEERDISALERVAEMICTAVEHAAAATRMQKEITGKEVQSADPAKNDLETHPAAETQPSASPNPRPGPPIPVQLSASAQQSPSDTVGDKATPALGGRPNIKKCQACGFPVSEGRTLCLDCEKDRPPEKKPKINSPAPEAPAFLSQLAASQAQGKGWLRSHVYLIGALLVGAMTVVTLLWLR